MKIGKAPELKNAEISPSIQHIQSSAITLLESCERKISCLEGSVLGIGQGEFSDEAKGPQLTSLSGQAHEILHRLERLDRNLAMIMEGVNGEA